MVHFKLAWVRHNVLMRHKILQAIRHIRHCHGSCVMGHTGQLSDGSRGSWVINYDQLSALHNILHFCLQFVFIIHTLVIIWSQKRHPFSFSTVHFLQFLRQIVSIIFSIIICNTAIDLPPFLLNAATLPQETSQLHSSNFSNQSYTLPLHKL